MKDSLDDFVGVFRVLQAFIALLALLIAYNATHINSDERAREHATLFAFGLPVRRVLWMDVIENVLLGVLGAAVGLAAGIGVLHWMTGVLLADTMPEIGLDVTVRPATWATVVTLGVGAVAVAPLLIVRRLTRMDLPDTLRIVE